MSVSTPKEKEFMFKVLPSDQNRRNRNMNIINKNKNVDEWGGVSKAIKKVKPKSKYAHNLKQVGMPQDGGFTNQDYVIKGISTNLSQGNPNNPAGEYKDKNRGLNDRIVKPKVIKNKTVKPKPKINISKNFPRIGPDLAHDVESNKKKPEVIESITVRPKPDIGRQVPDLSTPDYDPADKPVVDYSKNNKDPGLLMKGARRKKVGKGSYKRGTPTKTKMVLAPHRNPTNKKVRVADRPSKRKRPINKSGSSRLSGGGLVASLYESF
tara:strand:+ start:82 stop:879 length:798 start_codon:yes stop_codon:yes gene_type:complete